MKYKFLAFATVIFIVSGLTIATLGGWVNNSRVNYANKLLQKAGDTTDTELETSLLLQSQALSPTDEKRLRLAEIYFGAGEFEKATEYLKGVKSQAGLLVAAQNSLELGQIEIYNRFEAKITSEQETRELAIYKNFYKGDFESLKELPTKPTTRLGVTLKGLNTQNYSEIPKEGLLGNEIGKILSTKSGTSDRELAVANLFIENNSPNIARFILERYQAEIKPDLPYYLTRAKLAEQGQNPQEALDYYKRAIKLSPEDTDLYKKARVSAEKALLPFDVEYLGRQIDYLQKVRG